MFKHLIGCFCLAGFLVCSSSGCNGPDDRPGVVDPTSDFETQTQHDEALDQQPHGVAPDYP